MARWRLPPAPGDTEDGGAGRTAASQRTAVPAPRGPRPLRRLAGAWRGQHQIRALPAGITNRVGRSRRTPGCGYLV